MRSPRELEDGVPGGIWQILISGKYAIDPGTENMNTGARQYLDRFRDILTFIESAQSASIDAAAELLAGVIGGGGIVYLFGTGHSHCAAEDLVYRAGGLAAVDLINDPASSGEYGLARSGYMERLEGAGRVMLDFSGITGEDALLIISNSGINNEPVEAAVRGREMGIPVIAITSKAYSGSHQTRHSGGKKLMEVADIVIDTGVPFPDAMVALEGLEQPVGGASTAASIIVGQLLNISAVHLLLQRGLKPDVYMSGNLDLAEGHNLGLWRKYRSRVRAL